jgi:hypothetical protein
MQQEERQDHVTGQLPLDALAEQMYERIAREYEDQDRRHGNPDLGDLAEDVAIDYRQAHARPSEGFRGRPRAREQGRPGRRLCAACGTLMTSRADSWDTVRLQPVPILPKIRRQS